MKKKLLTSILTITMVFGATQMSLVTANDDGQVEGVMLIDAGVMPINDTKDEYDVENDMSVEDGDPSAEDDYSVDNNMSEQGGDPVVDDDYGVNNDMSEQGGAPIPNQDEGVTPPTSVPSTGVKMLAKLF